MRSFPLLGFALWLPLNGLLVGCVASPCAIRDQEALSCYIWRRFTLQHPDVLASVPDFPRNRIITITEDAYDSFVWDRELVGDSIACYRRDWRRNTAWMLVYRTEGQGFARTFTNLQRLFASLRDVNDYRRDMPRYTLVWGDSVGGSTFDGDLAPTWGVAEGFGLAVTGQGIGGAATSMEDGPFRTCSELVHFALRQFDVVCEEIYKARLAEESGALP